MWQALCTLTWGSQAWVCCSQARETVFLRLPDWLLPTGERKPVCRDSHIVPPFSTAFPYLLHIYENIPSSLCKNLPWPHLCLLYHFLTIPRCWQTAKIFGFLCWLLTFCPPHSECPCGSHRAMNQVWLTPLRLLSNLHGFLLNLVSMAMSLLNSSPE